MQALLITGENPTSTKTVMSATQLTFLITVTGKLMKKSTKIYRDRLCTAKANSTADSQWREILKCRSDVVFFLAEHNLSFHGDGSKISDPDRGLFLSALGCITEF